MDSGIELFIKESFIEDKADVLRESFEVFKKLNLEDYENEFNSILMEESNLDSLETLNAFEELVVSNLCLILLTHGVKVVDETPISLMNHVCTGLADIEYYLDATEMMRTIESDLDTEEKLSQILQYVTGVDEQLILTHLFKVNPALIDRVKDVFVKNSFESTEELEQRAKEHIVLKDLSHIARYFASDNFIGFNLIKAGVKVNGEFMQYLRYFETHIDDMKPAELAKELFVLLSMSSDGNKNVLIAYSKYSNILFHELDKISKIYSELNNIISLFDSYMFQRSSLVHDHNKEVK